MDQISSKGASPSSTVYDSIPRQSEDSDSDNDGRADNTQSSSHANAVPFMMEGSIRARSKLDLDARCHGVKGNLAMCVSEQTPLLQSTENMYTCCKCGNYNLDARLDPTHVKVFKDRQPSSIGSGSHYTLLISSVQNTVLTLDHDGLFGRSTCYDVSQRPLSWEQTTSQRNISGICLPMINVHGSGSGLPRFPYGCENVIVDDENSLVVNDTQNMVADDEKNVKNKSMDVNINVSKDPSPDNIKNMDNISFEFVIPGVATSNGETSLAFNPKTPPSNGPSTKRDRIPTPPRQFIKTAHNSCENLSGLIPEDAASVDSVLVLHEKRRRMSIRRLFSKFKLVTKEKHGKTLTRARTLRSMIVKSDTRPRRTVLEETFLLPHESKESLTLRTSASLFGNESVDSCPTEFNLQLDSLCSSKIDFISEFNLCNINLTNTLNGYAENIPL